VDVAEAFLRAMFNKWPDKKWKIKIEPSAITPDRLYQIRIIKRLGLHRDDYGVQFWYDGQRFYCNVAVQNDNGTYETENHRYDVMTQMDEFWLKHLRKWAKPKFKRRRTLPVFI
jgi:hypothetical protein